MSLPKRKILLGLTGTVATTLYLKIIKQFQDEGFEVSVVITERARHFLKYKTNEFAQRTIYNTNIESPPNVEFFHEGTEFSEYYIYEKGDKVPHIDIRDNHSAFVVICTANTLFKIANGVCDNLLTSIARAWPANKPFIIAPAMNTEMWNHPMTELHAATFKRENYRGFFLKSKNHLIVPPQRKVLACGEDGIGALADIKDIVNTTKKSLTWDIMSKFENIPINPHPGAFGYTRRNSIHSGVDLYMKKGDPVFPFEDGVVVSIEQFTGTALNTTWWNDTQCVLIKGASGVICYGEIIPDKELKPGHKVVTNMAIGKADQVIKERFHPEITGWKPSMLHVELYPFGTEKAVHGFCDKHIDPTPFLIEAMNNHNKNLEGFHPLVSPPNEIKTVTYDKYKPE